MQKLSTNSIEGRSRNVFMEKRTFERLQEKVRVDFHYDNELYEGTVTNLSCNGLHIDAEMCPPVESNLEVVLILGDEVFKLPGKVKRLVTTNELRGSMGVELSVPSQSYAEFVLNVMDYWCQKVF